MRANGEQDRGSGHQHRAPPSVSVGPRVPDDRQRCPPNYRTFASHGRRVGALLPGGYSPRHADCGRAVHRHTGSHRTATESRWSVHRLRDGIGRVGCSDDRHAGWVTRSSTHCLSGPTTGSRFRRRMLVLECRWHRSDLRRGRWESLAATRTGRKRATVDAARSHENSGRSGSDRRLKPCRLRPRPGRGVGDATRRRFDRPTRRRHRRFRVRPVPDAVQQRCRVAGMERAGHAMGSGATPTGQIRSNRQRRVPTDRIHPTDPDDARRHGGFVAR